MWRFAFRARDAALCSEVFLLENGIERDIEFSPVRAWDKDEIIFIVRDGVRHQCAKHCIFYLGLCCAAPTALWFEDNEVKW